MKVGQQLEGNGYTQMRSLSKEGFGNLLLTVPSCPSPLQHHKLTNASTKTSRYRKIWMYKGVFSVMTGLLLVSCCVSVAAVSVSVPAAAVFTIKDR
jgi:hypothetical protein